jgi:alpha-1,3-glucan synthase
VLLTGETGQTQIKLFIVAGTYIFTSLAWWLMVRRTQAVFALSLPWFFYGLSFLLLGLSSLVADFNSRGRVQDMATVFYAAAASSGALDFAMNFGDESEFCHPFPSSVSCPLGFLCLLSFCLFFSSSFFSRFPSS